MWEKLLAEIEAAQAIGVLLRHQENVTSLTITEAIKASPDGGVIKAELNGTQVMLKYYTGPQAAKRVCDLKRELDLLEKAFGNSDCRANKCLEIWPELGVAALNIVPGIRLQEAISQSDMITRKHLMEHSGRWLQRYANIRNRLGEFAPEYWMKRVEQSDISHIYDREDRNLLNALKRSMQRQTTRIQGRMVVQAATHGDYVGINAHYHDSTIYGVDIQGESWFALARDAANFLVWQQCHGSSCPDTWIYGIDADDCEAFLQCGLLSQEEQESSLRFFIGERLHSRFIENYLRSTVREKARQAIDAYCQEPA